MLALGPAVIFPVGLIPYLPFRNFQVGLMDVLIDMIPENSYLMLESLLQEIFDKHHGLQIFGFLVTMFFIQKGLNGIIEAFNATYHTVGSRPWIERHMVSVGLFAIFFVLVAVALVLLFFNYMGVKHLHETGMIRAQTTFTLLLVGKWVMVLAATFLAISFLYFLGSGAQNQVAVVHSGFHFCHVAVNHHFLCIFLFCEPFCALQPVLRIDRHPDCRYAMDELQCLGPAGRL